MKIYTEINYKWLDGQLVMTDSKSFDYEGELTLCNVDTGGGGGTAGELMKKTSDVTGDVLGKVEDAGGTVGDLATDVVGAAGDATAGAAGTALNEATGAVTRTADTAGDVLSSANEDLTFITDSLADPIETVAENVGDAGDMLNEGITSGAAATTAALDEGARTLETNAQGAMDYLGDRVDSGMQYGRDI